MLGAVVAMVSVVVAEVVVLLRATELGLRLHVIPTPAGHVTERPMVPVNPCSALTVSDPVPVPPGLAILIEVEGAAMEKSGPMTVSVAGELVAGR